MIHLLPPEVRSCLRSGVATPSLAQCVEELVLNSMDAEATCIAVRVDVPNCRIQVVDNGKGLPREDFELVGSRYATSKCHQLADMDHLQYFGYRGEALASISHISRLLEIVSRAKGTEVTLSKLFRSGKPSGVFEAAIKRPSVGTTVTVHSVFHNMPVRRKMISASLDYERVCQRVEGLALIHPDVSFSLRDDSTGAKPIQTRITSSLVNSFRSLFGQAKAKSLKEVTQQHGKFSISGYIGTEGHPNKNLQFVYVNKRLVLRTRLHKAINYLLRKSLIAHYKPRFGDRECTGESSEMQVIDLSNSPGKAADQYGILVLNVKCPLSEYDICLEPSKSLVEFKDWGAVLHCIEQLVTGFLTRENLTMKVEKGKQGSSPEMKSSLLLLDEGSSQEDDEGTEDQEMTEQSTSLSQKYGREICTSACSNTLQSLTVRRLSRKSSDEQAFQSSVSVEESGSQESDIAADVSRSEMLGEDELAQKLPKVHIISPSGGEDLGTEEPSELILNAIPTSCSPCISGLNENERVAQIALDSEETDEAVSVVFSTLESEEQLQKPENCQRSMLPRQVCQPVLESPNPSYSSAICHQVSCEEGSKHSPADDVNDKRTSNIQTGFTDNENCADPLGKTDVEHSKFSSQNENSPVYPIQQKQLDNQATDTPCESRLANCKETNPKSRTDLELTTKEECDDQFITPKTGMPDISRNCNKGPLVKDKISSASSELSLDSSSFNSEGTGETSDSSILIEQDAMVSSSKSVSTSSPESVRKGLQIHLIPEVKSRHQFIGLDSFVDNAQKTKNTGIGTSSSFDFLDRSASSLQIFRRSIRAKSCTDKSVRHSISELLQGANSHQGTSRFFPRNSGPHGQSTGFTTTSPVVLKRQFTAGLMMLGKHGANDRPANPQMSTETSRAQSEDVQGHGPSGQVTLPENSNLKTKGIENFGKTTLLSATANKAKSGDLQTNVFPVRPTSSASSDHPIPKEQVVGGDGELIQNKNPRDDMRHTSSAAKPNLKRLRKIHVPPAPSSILTDEKLPSSNGQDILTQEKGLEQKEAPQTKKFMTWDSFLQTVPPVRPGLLVSSTETSKGVVRFLPDSSSVCTQKLQNKEHQDGTFNPDIPHSKDSESTVKLQDRSHLLSIRDKVDITSTDDSAMQKGLTSEESISKRNEELQEELGKFGTLGDDDGREEMFSHIGGFIPPCPLGLGDSASEIPRYTSSCQDNTELPLAEFDDKLPGSVVLCDTTNFNLRRKELSGSVDSASQVMPSQSESAVFSLDVCPELSDEASLECNSHVESNMSLTAGIDKTTGAYDKTCPTAAEPVDEVLSTPELVSEGQVVSEDQQQHEGDRNSDKAAETRLHQSSDTSIPVSGISQSEDPPNEEEDERQTSCPQILTDVHGKSWSSHYDAKLKRQVYVDMNTGNCRFERPVVAESKEDRMAIEEMTSTILVPTGRKKSHLHRFHSACAQPFLPVSPGTAGPLTTLAPCANLSPSSHSALNDLVDGHVDQIEGEMTSKWRDDCPVYQSDGSSAVDQLFDNWTNPMFPSLDAPILDAQGSHLPRNSIRAQKAVHPYRFTKDMFRDIKVVGQVDNKFIACMVSTDERQQAAQPNLVLLIDQHAAHERVRLEQLMSDVFEDPRSGDEDDEVPRGPVKSSSVIPPVELSLPHKELRLLRSFGNKLEGWGISHRIPDGAEAGETDGGRVEITRLPACLVEREAAELKRGRQPVAASLVEALLAEHLEVLQKTSGASAVLPKTITTVLNSQACHGAIKFGDRLDHGECLSLIGQLSRCDLPFQCAHGRPSLVPLLDLKLLASTSHRQVDEHKPRLSRLHSLSG